MERREEMLVKGYDALEDAGFFDTEANAFVRDADVSFARKGNATEEKKELAGRGCCCCQDRLDGWHILSGGSAKGKTSRSIRGFYRDEKLYVDSYCANHKDGTKAKCYRGGKSEEREGG